MEVIVLPNLIQALPPVLEDDDMEGPNGSMAMKSCAYRQKQISSGQRGPTWTCKWEVDRASAFQ